MRIICEAGIFRNGLPFLYDCTCEFEEEASGPVYRHPDFSPVAHLKRHIASILCSHSRGNYRLGLEGFDPAASSPALSECDERRTQRRARVRLWRFDHPGYGLLSIWQPPV